MADHFAESPDWYDDDYASTVDPGSDFEPLSDSDDEDAPHTTAGGDVPTAVLGSAATSRGAQEGTARHTPCAPVLTPKRRIVEFCCGRDSRIGRRAPAGCEVIRLTIEDDLTTDAGLEKALRAVGDLRVPTLLFGSLPCKGGSSWQFIN